MKHSCLYCDHGLHFWQRRNIGHYMGRIFRWHRACARHYLKGLPCDATPQPGSSSSWSARCF